MRRILFALLLGLVASGAGAQTEDRKAAREREQVRRLQSQVQKVEGEKAGLQQQVTDLQKQKEDLDRKVKGNAALQRQLAETKRRELVRDKELADVRELLAKTQAVLEEEKRRASELDHQLRESKTEARGLGSELKDARNQNEQQREVLARQAKAIVESNDKNMKLYSLNVELLDRYKKKGVWDAMLQQEPVTGLKDVRMQALVQEYRDKLDQLKVDKPELAQ